MPRTWIDLPDDATEAVEIAARQDGIGTTAWMLRAVEQALTEPAPIAPELPSPAMTEDALADYVLGRLDPIKAQILVSTAREARVRPWHLFWSYIEAQVERGQYNQVTARARREADGLPLAPGTAAVIMSAACDHCGRAFQATRLGQRFCPDPDDGTVSCGRQAMLAEQRTRREGQNAVLAASHPPTEAAHAPQQQNTQLLQAYAQQRRLSGAAR